ncbi:PssE/Cps14G family polysaccharide biosynthesis glycosyltransferase [Shewanella baltica]|uniref:PssE/Cps14G family polysaccharide biosynthesis glycosyltransferase n=1 Tax=Shewanella baltica TaxID=62322 RepID=UPI003CFFE9A2
MKIFVTTGTTEFRSLIDTCLVELFQHEVIIQSPFFNDFESKYGGRGNIKFYSFVDNIADFYDWADLIITHAGAGSVYNLLELNKKVIVVPNLDRNDQHQAQLADFVLESNYASVCRNLSELNLVIESCLISEFNAYKNETFCGAADILKLFGLRVKFNV